MEKGIDNVPSNEVSSSHKVCDYLEDEGFIKPGGVTFYLADYCGLEHLCDELGDYMSDFELAAECNKHCFFVEFDDGDVVYRELHTKDSEAFKSELRHRITQALQSSKPTILDPASGTLTRAMRSSVIQNDERNEDV
jgi:hypothetical protein